jgi:RimJ/RimL family protein N-acetyltransferase
LVVAGEIRTKRLLLTPLEVGDAVEMAAVLADPALQEFMGGAPPSVEELSIRYGAQVAGSVREDEVWYNWIVRLVESGTAVGFVQATIEPPAVDVAWVIGAAWRGRGYASEAAAAMRSWIAGQGFGSFRAHIHPAHVASQRVATAIGLASTGELDEEGEEIWVAGPQSL